MTRINVVAVQCLADQHLMAEYRELPMVHAALKKSLRTKTINEVLRSVPMDYTLNRGHVTFFYNKLLYLRRRYESLISELINRGYDIDLSRNISEWETDIPERFFNDWNPTDKDVQVLKPRLIERLQQKPKFYKYLGQPVDITFYDYVEVYL